MKCSVLYYPHWLRTDSLTCCLVSSARFWAWVNVREIAGMSVVLLNESVECFSFRSQERSCIIAWRAKSVCICQRIHTARLKQIQLFGSKKVEYNVNDKELDLVDDVTAMLLVMLYVTRIQNSFVLYTIARMAQTPGKNTNYPHPPKNNKNSRANFHTCKAVMAFNISQLNVNRFCRWLNAKAQWLCACRKQRRRASESDSNCHLAHWGGPCSPTRSLVPDQLFMHRFGTCMP